MNPAERVRQALRHWLDTSDLTERQFAEDLKKSQPWLDKVLGGTNNVRLKDLDQIAAAMHTTASELVRDADDRYQLELSPTEVRLIERIRHGGPNAITAMHWLLGQLPKPEPVSQALQTVGQTALRPVNKRATKPLTKGGTHVHMDLGRAFPPDPDPAATLAALRTFLSTVINDIAEAAAGAIPDRHRALSDPVPDEASDRGMAE